MSRFKDKLDTAAIDDVTVFIRAWARNIEDLAPQGEVVAPLSALVLNPTGNAPEFLLRDQRYVPAVQVESALRSHARMVLLDARPKSDWFKSHIPGAYPAPFYDEHDPLFKALPADTWIVAYCSCPHAASGQLVDSLRAAGFEKTAVLDEGILEWARRKYPITFGSEIAK
jgi:rhodanese-related sulfurtransferase